MRQLKIIKYICGFSRDGAQGQSIKNIKKQIIDWKEQNNFTDVAPSLTHQCDVFFFSCVFVREQEYIEKGLETCPGGGGATATHAE